MKNKSFAPESTMSPLAFRLGALALVVIMMLMGAFSFIYIVPAIMILTTVTLLNRGYTPCPKLLISGSAWQLFWVNDKNACFKPTRYINDHWPCKMIGEQEVCIQVDGR